MAAKKQVFATEYTPPPSCAYEGCGYSSCVRVKTRTGWANLCERCYESHFGRQSKAYCSELGLTTIPEMKAWLKDNKLLVKKAPLREPGEGSDADVYGVAA